RGLCAHGGGARAPRATPPTERHARRVPSPRPPRADDRGRSGRTAHAAVPGGEVQPPRDRRVDEAGGDHSAEVDPGRPVRRHLLAVLVFFVFVTLVCVYIVPARRGTRDPPVRAYVCVVGALLMLAIVAAAGDTLPHRRVSDFDRALAASSDKQKPLRD